MTTRLSKSLWGLATFLSLGVALFSYRYLGPPNVTLSPQILANLFAKPWLMVHVAGAATALLVVGFQFLPSLRRRGGAHRWLGRIYATGCLVGGAGGLVMAFGTTAGTFAGVGFGLLALIWIYTTVQGWRTAQARRFDEHRAWIIRSFSLTFAAVTLRIYLGASQAADMPFQTAYPIIAWLAWVPNLAIAELYLRRGQTQRLMAAE